MDTAEGGQFGESHLDFCRWEAGCCIAQHLLCCINGGPQSSQTVLHYILLILNNNTPLQLGQVCSCVCANKPNGITNKADYRNLHEVGLCLLYQDRPFGKVLLAIGVAGQFAPNGIKLHFVHQLHMI